MDIDQLYKDAVDAELDLLARMTPCQLMQLQPAIKTVHSSSVEVEIAYTIADYGDSRNIGVTATRKLLVGHRKYSGGIVVQLGSRRMTEQEAAERYD